MKSYTIGSVQRIRYILLFLFQYEYYNLIQNQFPLALTDTFSKVAKKPEIPEKTLI